MGIIDAIYGALVYLDTNILLYALEGYPAFIQDLTQLFQSIDRGDLMAVTSELSLAEALVKPIKEQNLAQQATYKQTIRNSRKLSVIPVRREVLIQAAELRAAVNLKLPDAIHAATALLTQCSTFLTNDQRFQVVPGLSVVLLSEITSP